VRELFIDTSYLVALFHHDDEFHERAALQDLNGVQLVTTLLVLEEFLTDLSKRNARMKAEAAAFVDRLIEGSTVDILAIDLELFNRGLDLYRNRLDKSYSMVDCISMAVCTDRKITEVLTADRDFEQERFVALLRQ
jgi:uncharacterized protein